MQNHDFAILWDTSKIRSTAGNLLKVNTNLSFVSFAYLYGVRGIPSTEGQH